VDLELLKTLVERLRIEAIGEPVWVESKGVYEYAEQNIDVVVTLKLIRAAQGIHAMDILGRHGLFVDLGAINRCVEDCVSEVYFLLENYPNQTNNVNKFVKHFFSKTIDGHLSSGEEPVSTNKVHNAMVRSLTGEEQDESTKASLTKAYATFSGYIHAGYSHIMQMYGGHPPRLSFNISGIPSQRQKDMHGEIVDEAYKSVLYAVAHAAGTFSLTELHRDATSSTEKFQ
jgi:hypothetical protein